MIKPVFDRISKMVIAPCPLPLAIDIPGVKVNSAYPGRWHMRHGQAPFYLIAYDDRGGAGLKIEEFARTVLRQVPYRRSYHFHGTQRQAAIATRAVRRKILPATTLYNRECGGCGVEPLYDGGLGKKMVAAKVA